MKIGVKDEKFLKYVGKICEIRRNYVRNMCGK